MGNALKGRRRLELVEDRGQDNSPGRAQFSEGRGGALDCWVAAAEDFLLEVQGCREEKTLQFYRERVRVFLRWATETAEGGAGVPLESFKARHMRQYLAFRAEAKNPQTGRTITDTTRRLDAIAVRKFLEFCRKEDYLQGDPLADYQIPRASRSPAKCPSADEVGRLLAATQDRWQPEKNPDARFIRAAGRQFFSRRNHAILSGLVSTAARVGELLALRLSDFDAAARTVRFRDTKGDSDRTVPFEPAWGEIVALWLRVRPKASAADTLFVTEYGDALDADRFRQQFYKDCEFAKLEGIKIHSLRHYALTQISRLGVREAQAIAGHKSLQTTQIYLHTDAERMQHAHAEAAPLGKILVNKRSERQKRRKLI